MKKLFSIAIASLLMAQGLFATEYHVAKNGSDQNPGTAEAPFLTISKAAMVLKTGDTVTVHEGVYREWVQPRNSGADVYSRITYQAAEGEEVWIKGSESFIFFTFSPCRYPSPSWVMTPVMMPFLEL